MTDITINSPFDILPQTIITTSILPFISSDDWLRFRAASRSSYETVHGTLDVSHSHCTICQSSTYHCKEAAESVIRNHNLPNEEVENLWKLALMREYRFEIGSDNIKQSIHSPPIERVCFLSTRDVFTTPLAFVSWMHWRKLEARCGDVESVSGDGSEIPFRQSRISNHNRQVVGPYYLRAAAMWKKMETWFDASGALGHSIKRTLLPGKDLTSITHLHFRDDDVLAALVSVYSFYSGQRDMTRFQTYSGLFGGYSAYDFKCMMSWMPWNGLAHYTNAFGYLYPIASDITECLTNTVYLDLKSGRMLIGNIQTDEITHALALRNRQHSPSNQHIPDNEDSLLRWFEVHADRLSTGYYSIGNLSSESKNLSILHYPAVNGTTRCSRIVTRGIEVVASSTFHPFSNVSGEPLHVYSIRVRLLTSDDDGFVPQEQRGFKTCQLHLRHWIITKQIGSEVFEEEVRGEGVIGEYPLLVEGGYQNYSGRNASVIARLPIDSFERKEIEIGTFSYQSCTDLESQIFQGYLTFVPGSLYNPAGESFQVRVAPFHLRSNPDYFY